jgi:ATP-dependent RNA helicase SUPV3L1/SUV3
MPISFSPSAPRDARLRGAGVTAVLGPTNTGKTHLAIERMLGHSSGIIGLPLRLLAREVYNKIVDRVGADAVAFITGEEKIKPQNARYWVSTVEAMPRDLDVAFLAIDEVQLGADLERGHVFTDRILNRRAREETLVLGAATMPRRSAIVAFSTDEVYAIAELIKRQRGGAAVVLGALSPRTRNAQVALYQSGDVDYLVATDAIGMGLNLDVDHVAFASDRKFDGYQFRKLNPAELAQIAGRAGRAMRDGSFGTTGRCPPFESDLVQALESHSFEPVKILQWRNTDLDFSSLGALQATLAMTPKEPGLTRAPIAEDILVLEHAARDEQVRAVATTRQAIERLWEVCQVPDYRKIAPATHAELAVTLYGFLQREGNIPVDWFAAQVAQADRTDGGIDTLSNRIAHVRTWTFVANRPDWLADPEHWQGVTRAVEDRLSDALHERLAERFVDRRTSVLMRRLKESTMLETEIGKTGEVVVEGHAIGRLDGFVFAPDASAGGSEAKALQATAQKALAGEIDARAARLAQTTDDQFVLASDGTIRWTGEAVGRLIAAEEVLRPRVRVIADEQLTGASRDSVQARLDLWLKTHIEKLLAPLFALLAAEDITGIARGVAFQLAEALGVLERQKVAEDVKGLDQPARATLRKHGVRFGGYHIYVPGLLKPAPRILATQLWALKNMAPDAKGIDELRQLAAGGRTSIPINNDIAKPLYRIVGYRVCGERAVRVDILERLADLIRPPLSWREASPGLKPQGAVDGGGFTVTPAMTSLTGASGEDFASILRSLGYRMEKRPKPPEAAVATAEAPASPSAAAESIETEMIESAPDLAPELPAAELPATEPDATPAVEAEMLAADTIAVAPAATEPPSETLPGTAAAEIVAETAATVAAEEFIEVWRPGRPSERPRRHSQGNRPPREKKGEAPGPVQADAAVPASAQPEATPGQPPVHKRRPQRPHRQASQPERPRRRERDSERPAFARPAPERREKPADPNSPFAKLAALKAQLEADAKERR